MVLELIDAAAYRHSVERRTYYRREENRCVTIGIRDENFTSAG